MAQSVQSPRPTQWKKGTDSHKLSSDICMCSVAREYTERRGEGGDGERERKKYK